jgi:hypothetical protein
MPISLPIDKGHVCVRKFIGILLTELKIPAQEGLFIGRRQLIEKLNSPT